MRHPERYGPRVVRAGSFGSPGQSRARGLTRAILDTFPVVKFGPTADEEGARAAGDVSRDKDLESSPDGEHGSPGTPRAMEMRNWEMIPAAADGTRPISAATAHPGEDEDITAKPPGEGDDAHPQAGPSSPGRSPPAHVEGDHRGMVPAAIGQETCPICIVDFEEGDDLRLLPCEGKHKFHQQCVDPWLLELSSSCPICRQGASHFICLRHVTHTEPVVDFQALETMMSGSTEGHDSMSAEPSNRDSTVRRSRFSRYLRLARPRRSRAPVDDPTDPYMPNAAETVL